MRHDVTSRNEAYLNFIRSRPCSFCARSPVDPHHPVKRLRGISEAGMAQKGADHLAIPVCRRCHEKLHSGRLTPSRADLLELVVINLICHLNAPATAEAPANLYRAKLGPPRSPGALVGIPPVEAEQHETSVAIQHQVQRGQPKRSSRGRGEQQLDRFRARVWNDEQRAGAPAE